MLLNSGSANSISTPLGIRLAGATLIICLALMIAVACLRGIWLDEIWSIWASRHDIPLRDVFENRWLKDVHPPLFHAVNWLLEPITGLNIATRRLEELGPVVIFFICAFYISRIPEMTKFLVVFSILLFSNKYAVVYFGEYRSYFLQMSFLSITMMAMYAISVMGEDFRWKNDLPLAVILGVSAIFSLNIHYMSTFISGIALGMFLLDQIRQRHWRWSLWIIFAGSLAAIPLLGFYWLELSNMKATAADFWIETGFRAAVRMMDSVVRGSSLGNLVAAIAAGSVILGLWHGRIEEDPIEKDYTKIPWHFLLSMGAALLISSAALLAINQIKPVIVERYLISMAPIVLVMIAAVATAPLWSSRLIFVAFLANAAVTAMVSAFPELHNQRWYDTARHIRAQIDACPTTRVYALAPDLEIPYRASPGQLEVHEWGYRLVARYFRFPVELIQKSDTAAPQLSRECPTLFWAEHMGRLDINQLRDAPFARALPGSGLAEATLYRDDTGFILTLPPRPGAALSPALQSLGSASRQPVSR